MLEKKQTAAPVVDQALIDSFVDAYNPIDFEADADVVMDYASLREFFGCIRHDKDPDILPAYIKALAEEGFVFRASWSGTPCMFLEQTRHRLTSCPSLEDDSPEPSLLPGEEAPAELPEKPVFSGYPSSLSTL